MPVRTAVLAHGLHSDRNAVKVIYTCPGGRTAIAKDIRVSSRGPSSGFAIVTVVSGPVEVRIIALQLDPNVGTSAQGFIVLEPGDRIQIFIQSFDLEYHVSGSELDGVAP